MPGPVVQIVNGKQTAADQKVTGLKVVNFAGEAAISGTAVDWTVAQQQALTLVNGSQTLTFTNPLGVGTFLLRLIQPATGLAATIVWPTIRWVGSSPPTLTTTNAGIDIVSLYWNGTGYFGTYSLNFG